MALSTNWRLSTTTNYASGRDGDDANVGDQANPWATFGMILESNVATCSLRNGGVYNEGDFIVNQAGDYFNKGMTVFGDGFVVIDGGGFFPFFRSTSNLLGRFIMANITFMNCNEISNGTIANRANQFAFCKFYDCNNVDLNNESSRNLFVRCSTNQRFGSATTYFRNTFINSSLNILGDVPADAKTNVDGQTFLNCAFDATSSINNNGGIISYNLTNCAFGDDNGGSGFTIDGVDVTAITLDGQGGTIGTLYSDGEKFSGVLTVGTKAITFTNCFWTADMGFNAPTKDVYTLSNSPQSKLVNGNNLIGAFGLALFIDANHTAFDPLNSGVSIDANITRNLATGNFDINTSPGGVVISTDDPTQCITLPFTTTVSEFVEWSLQGFNFFNGEWVDDANYNDPANLEVRLTMKVSVYDESEPNGVNNPLNFGAFIEYELNTPLQQDALGRGNGDIDCDLANLGSIEGKRFRIEFHLRDDGV